MSGGLVVDDRGEQAGIGRLAGVEALAGQRHAGEEARSITRSAGTRDHGGCHSDPHLGEGERARRGGHGEVRRRDESESAGARVAVDAGDDRHRALDDAREDVGHPVRRRTAPLGEVGAGAEHRARTREDDGADARVARRVTQCPVQLVEQLRRQGVAVVRRVQRQGADALAVVHLDQRIRHVAQCRGVRRKTKKRRWYRAPVVETDEHRLFRKTLRDLFEREIEPHVEEWEAARTFPAHELFPKLGAVGLFGLEYDEAYGGMGADHTFTLVAAEEMGRISCGGVPMAIAVQMSMSTPALARYGSPELKERYLAPAIRGEVVTSIAVTEPDAGSDVAGIRTRAVRDGDEWVINGSKLYITNGTQADWLCLLARTSDDPGSRGMSLIVVPTDVAGVAVSRKLEKLGMWSSDTAELSFTDVRVPLSNTIGEIGRGFQQQMVQFQAERLTTFYKQVGSIELALERTKAYLRERRAFGAPLMANQYPQFVLAELGARHDVLKHYARTTAEAVVQGEDATRYATIGKLLGSRLQREVADWAVQFHGGMGYMDENWTSRYFRDTRLDSIGAGADEVMLRILARMDGYTAD